MGKKAGYKIALNNTSIFLNKSPHSYVPKNSLTVHTLKILSYYIRRVGFHVISISFLLFCIVGFLNMGMNHFHD